MTEATWDLPEDLVMLQQTARRFMRGEDARRVAGDALVLLLSTTLAIMALAAVAATAVAWTLIWKLPLVNSSKARWFSKKMIWLYACPPAWKPRVSWLIVLSPT